MRKLKSDNSGLDRRQILKGGLVLGGGLVIGLRLTPRAAAEMTATGELMPNAFVRIAPDGSITVISKHIEFGQGTYTGLATVLAEELDADWSQVGVESAPADVEKYKNLFFGVQGTGGSTAMANSWMQMRQAGATARALLVAAAAETWSVPVEEITVEKSIVTHKASGRSATFGELVDKAATLEPPAEVTLKEPSEFTLIGHETLPRVDVPAKTRGEAQFTFDFTLPGMLTAVIERPPVFGATVAKFDATAAGEVPGVVEVVEIPQGIAVLAEGFWAARNGRRALSVDWDDSSAEKRSSDEIFEEYRGLLDKPGLSARNDGDAEEALAGATKVLSADYEFPYLAHAPMEPLDCAIRMTDGECDIWAGSQIQTIDQGVVAGTLGLEPGKVRIHTLLGGGSFGRRATPNGDVFGEAAAIVKATEGKYPVKLVWTREDDIRGGMYRPMVAHRLRAGVDESGKIIAWSHRLVSQSIMTGTAFEMLVQDGIDGTSVEGAKGLPYAIPNLAVDLHTTNVGVPVLWWRSVGHSHTAYSTETFFDEIASATNRDPVELRRELLSEHPRLLGVLNLAAEKAGWGDALPENRARGVAVHESFSSYVAEVVEVSLADDGMPKVERVVCAVDCGIAINPDVIRSQMESGIGYGLGAALHDEIVLDKGRVKQSNFHNFKSLRMREMPTVEVHIVPSTEPPTGVGEPGVPPIAPAVANAFAALTGQRVYRLPFRRALDDKKAS
jgi:isoquinoline 1-oxidoreductase beta subunit